MYIYICIYDVRVIIFKLLLRYIHNKYVHMYVHIYIYICMYIYLYIYICGVPLSVSMHIYIYICIYMGLPVRKKINK